MSDPLKGLRGEAELRQEIERLRQRVAELEEERDGLRGMMADADAAFDRYGKAQDRVAKLEKAIQSQDELLNKWQERIAELEKDLYAYDSMPLPDPKEKQDAERYRWLRDHGPDDGYWVWEDQSDNSDGRLNHEWLNKIIDAAREK